MLIVFSGLPGAGKSTLARMVAQRMQATYVRIDTIEQALRTCGTLPDGVVAEGYAVAYRVAEDNLQAGGHVVADSVNPLAVTRDAWLAVAERAGATVVEIEVVCSDLDEHRRRVEGRVADVPGLVLPSWQAVQQRNYEPWARPHLVIDTAGCSAVATAERILAAVGGGWGSNDGGG